MPQHLDKVMRWVPIETAPKDGYTIWAKGLEGELTFARWDGTAWINPGDNSKLTQLTHWSQHECDYRAERGL